MISPRRRRPRWLGGRSGRDYTWLENCPLNTPERKRILNSSSVTSSSTPTSHKSDSSSSSYGMCMPFGNWTHRDELDVFGVQERKEISWPFLHFASEEDDNSDDGYMVNMADYYLKHPHRKKTTSLVSYVVPPPPSPINRQHLSRINASPPLPPILQMNKHLSVSESFETQDTHLEESSETSLSTQTSCDEGSPKSVRWAKGRKLVKIHSFRYSEPTTCRIVILLLMNNGPDAPVERNFEFLHCEFRQDDRVKVSEVLAQITCLTVDEPHDQSRPFTALYSEGRELINALLLQDNNLIDGQSILVAVRNGTENRDVLLAQAEVLLKDKTLRQEIRKARIAGRSLQTLYGSEEWKRRQEEGTTQQERKQEEEEDIEDSSVRFSPFDNLSSASFDEDEFGGCFTFEHDVGEVEWIVDHLLQAKSSDLFDRK